MKDKKRNRIFFLVTGILLLASAGIFAIGMFCNISNTFSIVLFSTGFGLMVITTVVVFVYSKIKYSKRSVIE